MSNCIKQAQVTEMTLLGLGGTGTSKVMPWDNFFKIILAHAKLIDHGKASTNTSRTRETNTTQTTSSGRGGGRNSNSGRGRGGGCGNGAPGG